jgi:multidrug resistance efflux pump
MVLVIIDLNKKIATRLTARIISKRFIARSSMTVSLAESMAASYNVAVMPQTGGTVIAIYGDTTRAVTEGQLLAQPDA